MTRFDVVILSENKIRSLVRSVLIEELALLKEDFLSSKVDSLESVSIDDKKFIAYGYFNYQGKESVMILADKGEHQFLMKKGAKLLPVNSSHSLRNHGNKFNQKALKLDKKSSYAVPVQTKGIKFSSVKLDIGKASDADLAIEIAGILGPIPLIGDALDIAAGVTAAVKDPPDYLISAFSLVCAIPVLGIAAAFAKGAVKKIGSKSAKEAGELISKELKEAGLEEIDLKVVKQQSDEIIDNLRSPEVVEQIAVITNNEADEIVKRLDEVENYVDEMINSLKVFPETAGFNKLAKESLKGAATKVFTSLSEGSLRNSLEAWAKDLSEKIATDVSEDIGKIIGKEFKHELTSQPIVFENLDQFKSSWIEMAKIFDSSINAEQVFYESFLKNTGIDLTPVSSDSIEKITSIIMSKVSKTTIKIIEDPELWKTYSTIRNNPNSHAFFRTSDLSNNPTIEIAAFGDHKITDVGGSLLEQALEHEIIHVVDRLIITTLASGDKVMKDFIDKNNIIFASDISGAKWLTSSSGEQLSKYTWKSEDLVGSIKSLKTASKKLTSWQYLWYKKAMNNPDFYSLPIAERASQLAYLSRPTELLTRVQRISGWLVENGFEKNDWIEFFNRDYNVMKDAVHEVWIFKEFFAAFKRGSVIEKNAIEDFSKMLDSLI